MRRACPCFSSRPRADFADLHVKRAVSIWPDLMLFRVKKPGHLWSRIGWARGWCCEVARHGRQEAQGLVRPDPVVERPVGFDGVRQLEHVADLLAVEVLVRNIAPDPACARDACREFRFRLATPSPATDSDPNRRSPVRPHCEATVGRRLHLQASSRAGRRARPARPPRQVPSGAAMRGPVREKTMVAVARAAAPCRWSWR